MVNAFKGYLGAGKSGAVTDLSFAAVARDRFARYVDCDWRQSNGEELDPNSGRAEVEEAFLGPLEASIDFTLEGSMEGILGYLLRSIFGAASSAQQGGTAAYLHTYTVADTHAAGGRLTFEKKYGASAQSLVGNGVINRLRYDFTQRGMVRIGGTALTANPAFNGSPTAATLPAANVTRLSQYMHALTFDGGSVPVRQGFVEYVRGNDEDDFTATSRARRDAELGSFMANTEFELQFTDLTHLRRFWGAASATGPGDVPAYYPFSLVGTHPTDIVGAAGHKYTLTHTLPKLYLQEVSIPLRSKDVIIQTVRGTATYDAATSAAATVTLKNSQTTT